MEELDADECWRLLRLTALGRLAVTGADGHPDVMPLNYLVQDRAVFFRTTPGTKLDSIEASPHVAFEIDGQDDVSRWSVVVRGTARQLTSPAEIEAAGITLLISWTPTYRDTYVRLTPETVSGRRFRKRRRRDSLPEDARALWAERDGVPSKPSPIPHRPPLDE